MPESHGDINLHHPLVRLLPESLLPYAALVRLDRPIGFLLCWLPAMMGLNLAFSTLPADQKSPGLWLWFAAIFLLGAWLVRSAFCIWNDWLDRDIDRLVARTRSRPLAAGTVSSQAAFGLMAVLLAAAAGLLLLFDPVVWWAGLAIVPLCLLYPMMKRWTAAPQLWLGLCFNTGVWVAWLATRGLEQLWMPTLLYGGCLCWTLGYDTVYALQDRADDRRVGVGSLALTLGTHVRTGVLVCTLLTAACWMTLLGLTIAQITATEQTTPLLSAWIGVKLLLHLVGWVYLGGLLWQWLRAQGHGDFSGIHGNFFRKNAYFGGLICLSLL